MKKLILAYAFNAPNKTVTLNGYTSIDLEAVLLITNVTTNTIIYNFANPLLGATVSGNILTLDYNTTGMSSSDKLQIFLDDGNVGASDITAQAISDIVAYQKLILNQTKTLATQDSSNRLRVAVEAMPTTAVTVSSGSLTSAGTVTNTLTTTLGASEIMLLQYYARSAFASGIRTQIT